MTRASFGAVLAITALAACKGGAGAGGSGVSNQFCHAIAPAGSAATCSNTCVGVGSPGAAFDGSFDTAASMAAGSQATFSGTAPQQVGGSVAGVYFVFPSTGEGITVTITTYLDGVQQETAGPASRGGGLSSTCPPNMDCSFTQGPSFVGLETTLDYDRIDATVSNSGAGGLMIAELCVR